jgi:YD repeat-containing protein
MIASIKNSPYITIPRTSVDAIIAANSSSVFASKPIDTNLYEYDDQGRVSRIVNGNGKSTYYGYDSFDRLESIYDTNQRKVKSFDYYYHHNSGVVNLYTLQDAGIDDYGVNNNVLYLTYHLPYEFEQAELKIFYVLGSIFKYSTSLPEEPSPNSIQIPLTYGSGPLKVCLYLDGIKRDEVRYDIPNF